MGDLLDCDLSNRSHICVPSSAAEGASCRILMPSPCDALQDLACAGRHFVARPRDVLVGTHEDPPRFIRVTAAVERIAHDA